MRRDIRSDISKPFRLAHQTLCITAFNFETESLMGYVEMLIHPLWIDLRKLKLNSKQCRIYRVAVNDIWEAAFSYNDPTLEICQGESKQRNLDYFESCHQTAMNAVDPDYGNGELLVKLPAESWPLVGELKPFRLVIEFALERPNGGVKFVVPDVDGTMLDRGAHLFTYGHENSARLWFPCVDSFSEVCTWKLELTVEMYMTAVAPGDLIETVYTPDLKKKTYHYFLSTPTAALNIGLAVGPFEVHVDPTMHEVTHFCLPHLTPVLKHSVSQLHEAFEFYEELLSNRYPYSCYKQVFVDQAYVPYKAYATLSIFSTNLLHSKRIIDQTPESRSMMAHALAEQFFGCYACMHSWFDAWLPKGISRYLASLYKRKAFGNNEYRFIIAEEMKDLNRFEEKEGRVILDPSLGKETGLHFSIRNPHTVSSLYREVYEKKAHLVIRMLEMRTGKELLLQVFNKVLTLASAAAQQKVTSQTWSNMLMSSSAFLKAMSTVTGKDVHTFIEQWAHSGGCARFTGSFVFNRKRNVVEMDLKPDFSMPGSMIYVGPLTVSIQELDGTFNHTFNIEENKSKFEITCHSKSRRQKKKKIPLFTGEEIDMDLNDMDPDSPVLWLRVDPEINILRSVKLEQPDYMWQYMLRYEKCVVAQANAIEALEGFCTAKTRMALTHILENDRCFYRVRIQAAFCLAKVANLMEGQWAGPPAMMNIFRKIFGSVLSMNIVRRNNFNNIQHYFIQKAIPTAMATLRNSLQICPPEVFEFILELIKFNDNSKNAFSDNYYRADLLTALATTLTPAVNIVTVTGMCPSTDLLTPDTKKILEEISRCLNMEKLLPTYKHTITISCLQSIRRLQKFGHLPSDWQIFKSYSVSGNFSEVRLAALEALVDYTRVEANEDSLNWLLDVVEEDSDPYLRHQVLNFLIMNPPFTRIEESHLCREALVDRLWKLMNNTFSYDCRLRCDVAELYYKLFGRTRPSCVPIPQSVMVFNLKDRTTSMNPSVFPKHLEELRGVKRRSDSPEVYTPTTQYSEDSQMKLKIKFGSSKSPPEMPPDPFSFSHQSSLGTSVIEPMQVDVTSPVMKTPSQSLMSPFESQFMSFAGVAAHGLEQVKPELPEEIFPPMAVQEVVAITSATSQEGESSRMSRLSESSDSNSGQFGFNKPAAEKTPGPTAFSSSMFESMDRNSPLTVGDDSSSVKSHKSKKKKKKHKHKHKHKRAPDDPPSESLTQSSGPSNTNSPVILRDRHSSPEFEVI